jgi:nonribosomal peptide synthetase DhbF
MLSPAWIAQAIDPASSAFNIAEYVDIRGPLRPDLFAAALRQVVNESYCLRLRISSHPEGVRQSVAAFLDWELPCIDFSSQAEPLAAADVWMREDLARPVQLNRDPLFFCALLRLSPARFFWYVRYHHLCMDGFSGALIAKRATVIYCGKLEVHTVHCKHYEMTEPAPIKTIGKILNQKLREIEASTQTLHDNNKLLSER